MEETRTALIVPEVVECESAYPSGQYIPYRAMSDPMGYERHGPRSGGYDYKKFTGRHHQVLRLHVSGLSNLEIAETLGVSPTMVSTVINSELGREVITDMEQGAMAHLSFDMAQHGKQLLPRAARYLESIIDGEVEGVSHALRAKVASAHLARMGHGEIKKAAVLHAEVSRDDVAKWRERLREVQQELVASE